MKWPSSNCRLILLKWFAKHVFKLFSGIAYLKYLRKYKVKMWIFIVTCLPEKILVKEVQYKPFVCYKIGENSGNA